eukprot:TRINITY_DN80273_c0_g1_i1.p1 TRINITY_DN80273_c0_g1~~TRINITY_DN80273_c0_g1_i1.p1  ORF type:complete len:515 (-),score=86.86 TRINITY_DN80273_c0_g1_i1:310-1854(-)
MACLGPRVAYGMTPGMKGSPRDVARPLRSPNTNVFDPTDPAQGRKMFDKRFLRRAFRDKYEGHLDAWREKNLAESPNDPPKKRDGLQSRRVRVCVRKRPLFEHEVREDEFDVVSCRGDEIVMHNCLTKPDLKSLYVHHHGYRFCEVFDDRATDDDVYDTCASPAVEHALERGVSTIFMFGQTGSGKTHTMDGILQRAASHIFGEAAGPLGRDVTVTAFEIAGKNMRDLLAEPSSCSRLALMQDQRQQTRVVGLAAHDVRSPDALLDLIRNAMHRRTTRATSVNDTSSRSHAVLRISSREGGSPASGPSVQESVLTLVDCAGTERREDTAHHDAQSRKDATEINSSLFALKECFRVLRSSDGQQPPYRESFLTRVLADSFSNPQALVIAIGTVSPSATDTEHSIATLRALQQLQGNQQQSLDSKEDLAAQRPASTGFRHPKNWNEDEVRQWFSQALNGQAAAYVPSLSRGTDGKNLTRWPAVRFSQLCGGDADLGDRLYQELRRAIQRSNSSGGM